MNVTAWNNGQHHASGAGYGVKVAAQDRDVYFNNSWTSVFISLPGVSGEVEVNINKRSFWGATCGELISHEFGSWLRTNGYAPWPSGAPPKFKLVATVGNHFKLEAP
jgi:hypothetical protein